MSRLFALLATAVVLVGAGAPPAEARIKPGKYAQQAFTATNANREHEGLKALKANDCLKEAAVRQATLMAQREEIFHQDLGAVMSDCKLNTAGENVAYGYGSGKSVVNQGWMNSEGHRANILSPSFKLMGIGARKGHDGNWYVAQVFGARSGGRVAERAAPQVSMFIDDRKPGVGEVYGISGRVTPSAPGDRVTLQVRMEGGKKWRNVRTENVGRSGGYYIVHQANKPGVRSYRTFVQPTAAHPKAKSRTVALTAYEFRSLKSLTPVASTGFSFANSATINDLNRKPALVSVGDGVHTIDFQIDGRCTDFYSHVGRVTGSAPAPARAEWSVTGSSGKVTGGEDPGDAYLATSWELKGVDVLRLTATTSDGAVVAFGEPDIYCSF